MTLMVNGKKVLGYAIGGNEFYSLDKFKVSVSIMCDFFSNFYPNQVSIRQDQPLSPGSAFTLKYLRDKGEKIKLILTFNNHNDGTASVLESGTIDLSKPDSNGHFNIKWANNDTSTNSYCYFHPKYIDFIVYSDAFSLYSLGNYTCYMQILYLD